MRLQSLVILDDDALTRKVLQHLGRQCGYKARGYATARPFLDQGDPEEDTLIILDVVMPDQDGMEVLRILSERGCRNPILLVSGYSADYLKLALSFALTRGLRVVGVLQKPASNKTYREILTRLAHEGDGVSGRESARETLAAACA